MKPTKYELFERDGAIVLRGYAPEAQNGWFNVEVVNRISWRTIPNLRKHASRSRTSSLATSSATSEGVAAQGGINTRRMSASYWASFQSNA